MVKTWDQACSRWPGSANGTGHSGKITRIVAEVEYGDGVLRHIVKVSVAQYNVEAAHTTTFINRLLSAS
jgi:hypothetical protein